MYRGISVVALLVALSTISHGMETEDIQAIEASKVKCVNEVQYNDTGIVNLTESLNNDPKLRCLLGCIWREMGSVNEDNSFNTTKWIEMTPDFKPELANVFNGCAAEKGADLCETAYKFYICLETNEEYRAI